ncbi:MAG TPA: tetratricopeptide repeat protein [Pyrinomonadaceae bacterium]|nr:tetratricopeptide repeat protein [Pyrinomonadaceae bacterium]
MKFRPKLLVLFVLMTALPVMGQSGYVLWGDVKIDDSKAEHAGPSSVTVVLYDQSTKIVGRQSIGSRGRYRFSNLRAGEYDVAIEANGGEITRVRLTLTGNTMSDYRQDFDFVWVEKPAARASNVGVVSAADFYDRPAANKPLFEKAYAAVEKKDFANAVRLLNQIVEKDKNDFQCWTLLGTLYLAQEKSEDAENAYLTAIDLKPTYALPLINLGRMRLTQKKFEEAAELLTKAVEQQPESPDANLLLGEAYLRLKKGSRAIPYLNEAGKLGKIEAHLDLGWLYNAAGLKDKAVVEYEQVLRKKPDYADRKKLEQYISENKKN